MRPLHPPIEPHQGGMLDVGDGHRLRYDVSGKPDGLPGLFLHGGPGRGCKPEHREAFVGHLDPAEGGGVDRFRQIPGVIVHGRYDMIAPVDGAIALARAWPQARMVIVEDGSHCTGELGVRDALLDAADRFAASGART